MPTSRLHTFDREIPKTSWQIVAKLFVCFDNLLPGCLGCRLLYMVVISKKGST